MITAIKFFVLLAIILFSSSIQSFHNNEIQRSAKINPIKSIFEIKSCTSDCKRPKTCLKAIEELGDEEEILDTQAVPATHGYEGNFKIGDKVKVVKNIRIWSVKPYTKEGFIAENFVGTVHSLALYGRKYNTLCSAITPVKVEFQPTGDGIPANMFEKKWIAHFSADELELLQ
eukprot:gene10178-13694_t